MKLGSILLLSALSATLLLGASTAPVADAVQPKVALIEAPGEIVGTSTIITTAVVQKIDKKTREVTLKKETGEIVKIVASNDVRNFAQIKVGDIVTSQLSNSIDIHLVKGASGETGRAVQESSSRAKLGEKPQRSETITVASRVKVTALDTAKQTITVEGQGGTTTVLVKDPEQFKLIAVDDMIDITITETIAISVTAPTKKK